MEGVLQYIPLDAFHPEVIVEQLTTKGEALVDDILSSSAEVVMDYAMCCGVLMLAVLPSPTLLGNHVQDHMEGLLSLCVFFGLLIGMGRNHPDRLEKLMNPFDLSVEYWFAAYAVKTVAIYALDWVLTNVASAVAKGKKLQYRVPLQEKGIETDHPLLGIDYFYMFINSFLETVFLMHLGGFIWFTEDIKWALTDINLVNFIPALWITLFMNDMYYAPMHWLFHRRWLYAFVHKHHHRSLLPSRYYVDAGNEHPWEQVGGLMCLWLAAHSALYVTGIHVGVLLLHFPIYTTMQLFNHSPYDLQFNVLGIHYEAGMHEMHHRIPTVNMAQYCMTFDKLIGTYRPYSAEH
eukprot:TRINITY_DN12652_c0_g1_i1.p2 TRINITY_DN12652_c0_g1~~TRINITY_DN12652_c0_g1_i1.p2  ORF type:complete len:363 (+),score=165.67 TRINITY_DN12652_c0_g1_i1:46-1089(+)